MIKDSVNVLFEGLRENRELRGSIEVPEGGEQSANLVVSGTTSGVTLKEFDITSGAGKSLALSALIGCCSLVFGGMYMSAGVRPYQTMLKQSASYTTPAHRKVIACSVWAQTTARSSSIPTWKRHRPQRQ